MGYKSFGETLIVSKPLIKKVDGTIEFVNPRGTISSTLSDLQLILTEQTTKYLAKSKSATLNKTEITAVKELTLTLREVQKEWDAQRRRELVDQLDDNKLFQELMDLLTELNPELAGELELKLLEAPEE